MLNILFFGAILLLMVLFCTISFSILFFSKHKLNINIRNSFIRLLLQWSIYIILVLIASSVLIFIGIRFFIFGVFAIPIVFAADVYSFSRLRDMYRDTHPRKAKKVRPVDSSYTGIR